MKKIYFELNYNNVFGLKICTFIFIMKKNLSKCLKKINQKTKILGEQTLNKKVLNLK